MKKILCLAIFAIASNLSFADTIPQELVGNYTPLKSCPKKFEWNLIQDAFVIRQDKMEGFSGDCSAKKVQKSNDKIDVVWNCSINGENKLSYKVLKDGLEETNGSFKSKYKKCK